MYQPTWDSVSAHQVPSWYEDAKLGIFLHWGLYSVPGWAPQVANIQELLRERGPSEMLKHNPYAEWYMNTMQIDGSPTRQHHQAIYGAHFPYDGFVETFDTESSGADLDAMASICKKAGAGYVVLTTKHHDGFTLWPSSVEHPTKGSYHAKRDLVGELTEAVRAQGMAMGLYYSGGYDWPYNGAVLKQAADTILAVPNSDEYREYATAHVREIIDRYRPSVLWNDICWPAGGNLAELFAYYYNEVDDGVINDRWLESTLPRNQAAELAIRGLGLAADRLWKVLPGKAKSLTFPSAHHFDFETPEYSTFDQIREKKWEATRGVGHSFGANRNERPRDIVTATELVRTFVDIVSKNGNLLIGIGPEPDGTIPAEQRHPLEGLGGWMEINSEAIVGSRPWKVPEGRSSEGTPLRFTTNNGAFYAILVDSPGAANFELLDVKAAGVEDVRLLGVDENLEWSVDDGRLRITLPDALPVSPAHTLRLAPAEAVQPKT